MHNKRYYLHVKHLFMAAFITISLLVPVCTVSAETLTVADTFDAMNSTRPYREKLKMEDIVAELKRAAGTRLNEKYVQVLLTLIQEGRFDE